MACFVFQGTNQVYGWLTEYSNRAFALSLYPVLNKSDKKNLQELRAYHFPVANGFGCFNNLCSDTAVLHVCFPLPPYKLLPPLITLLSIISITTISILYIK